MFNVNGIDRQLTKLENVIGKTYDKTRNDEALRIIYDRLVTIANRMIDTDGIDEADPDRMSSMEKVALAMAKVWVETKDENEVYRVFAEGIAPLARQAKERKYQPNE